MTALNKNTTKSTKSPAPATKTTKPKAKKAPAPAAKVTPVAPAVVKTASVPAKPAPTPAKAAPAAAPAAAVTPAPVPAPAVKVVKPTPVVTTITAKIDIGFGNALYVRGEGPGLSWDRGAIMTCVGSDEWQVALGESARPFIFKFLVNDLTWSAGPDFAVESGSSITLTPEF